MAATQAARVAIKTEAWALLGLFCLTGTGGCAASDPAALAARLDREGKTGVYGWLREHDPSSLDVAGVDPAPLRPLVPDGTLRRVSGNLRQACAAARRDRALLLVIAPRSDGPRRDAAEDCGFAVYRDPAALAIAPR